MTRHLFKLIWNRKRANALIVLEIVACFLVLFAVVAMGSFYASNYGAPLGFDYDNVWNVAIDMKQVSDDSWDAQQVETTRQILLAIKSMDDVEAAAGSLTVPFSYSSSTGSVENGPARFEFDRGEVTDDLPKVLGLRVTRGRWFGAEDTGAAVPPVVINESLARGLFGDEDPVGRMIMNGENVVIGVVDEYRRQGEFVPAGGVVFFRRTLEDNDRPPRNVLVRVRPGTPPDFEQRLLDRVRATAPQWSFDAQPLDEARATNFRFALAPLLAVALVAGFLILMVALGLIGILWQNVSRRRREIGIRRAQGATARHIFGQILGETAALTTVSLLVGCAVVAQLPLVGATDLIGGSVFATSLAVSVVVMYLLTTACSLYPSWLATRVRPAEALHYD